MIEQQGNPADVTTKDAPGSGPTGPTGPATVRAASRIRIAIATAWLVVAAGLAYIAPGTPWSDSGPAAPVVTADPHGHGATPGVSAPAMTMDMSQKPAGAYSGFIRTAENTVAVDVTPGTVGVNTVAFTVLDAQGLPLAVKSWSATATLTGSTLKPVVVTLDPFGESAATATSQLPAAGKWTFTIRIRTAAGPATFTHVVPIAG